MAKRLSLLMGISIFMVVLGHAAGWGQVAMFDWAHRYRPVTSPNFDMIGTPAYYFLAFLRQSSSFAVAVFLFVGGFFSAFSARSANKAVVWKSVRARIVTLLIPYTIWSVLIFIYRFLLGERLAFWEYPWQFLTIGAAGPYYYVPLLCYLSLLAPLLVPLAKNRPQLLLWLSFLAQFILMGFRYIKLFQAGTPLAELLSTIAPAWLFLQWILYFTLGLVTAFHLEDWKAWATRHRTLLLVMIPISLVAAVLEVDWILRVTHINIFSVPLLVTTLVYTLAVLLAFTNFAEVPPRTARLLNDLGSRSYGIYLLHYTIMEITAKVIYRFHPPLLANPWLLVPILFVLGLGIPILFMEIFRRTPLRKVQRYLFG